MEARNVSPRTPALVGGSSAHQDSANVGATAWKAPTLGFDVRLHLPIAPGQSYGQRVERLRVLGFQ